MPGGGEWWAPVDTIVEALVEQTPNLYRTRHRPNPSGFQATPLMVGGVLYFNTPLSQGVAVDGAPNSPRRQFRDHLYAPPMRPRIVDESGSLRAPFVYPLRLVDRVERRYEEDRTRRLPLTWFTAGRLVQVDSPDDDPLLLLGGDHLGRDVFARLVLGARLSLGVALTAALGALIIGALLGAAAGATGGLTDEVLMRTADFVLVLPAIYVVLALRAVDALSPVDVGCVRLDGRGAGGRGVAVCGARDAGDRR